MMIILSWNFSLGISFINQKRKPDKKQEKHTQWLKLRIIYRSDCAIGELLWKDIWYHFKGPDTLHGHGLLSTHLRVVCLIQLLHTFTNNMKKTNTEKQHRKQICAQIFRLFLLHSGRSSFSFVFSEAHSVRSSGGFSSRDAGVRRVVGYLDVNLWGNSFSLQNCEF